MYTDRREAGKELGKALKKYGDKDAVVLALPRGGIVLGAEVAKTLQSPLDVVLVRKIGHPFSPEYAIGAVVLGENPVLNQDEIAQIDSGWLEKAVAKEQKKNQERKEMYYGLNEPTSLKDKTIIVVDDGIATGLTMKAAVMATKNHQPEAVIVAVPVAPIDSIEMLKALADEVVILDKPEDFMGSVGVHYREFPQVDDTEVKLLLRKHHNQKH